MLKKCCHDPNKFENTLYINDKYFKGSNPKTQEGICKMCNKSFKFILEDNGKFKKI